jgi:hypothetical protein
MLPIDDPAATVNVRQYLQLRAKQIQRVLDASDPPTTITVEVVLDQALAPIFLRRLFGYKQSRSAAQLVSDLLAAAPNVDNGMRRDEGRFYGWISAASADDGEAWSSPPLCPLGHSVRRVSPKVSSPLGSSRARLSR